MRFGMRINFVDVICDGSLQNTYANGAPVGFRFSIRLSYYRGLFLSCIDCFEVFIDGERIADQDISFAINGKSFSAWQLPECSTEFWSLLEPAVIEVFRPGGLAPGPHHIRVALILRSPYLPIPGSGHARAYVPIDGCGEKVLELSEGVNAHVAG